MSGEKGEGETGSWWKWAIGGAAALGLGIGGYFLYSGRRGEEEQTLAQQQQLTAALAKVQADAAQAQKGQADAVLAAAKAKAELERAQVDARAQAQAAAQAQAQQKASDPFSQFLSTAGQVFQAAGGVNGIKSFLQDVFAPADGLAADTLA